MIPSEQQIQSLWDTYSLPPYKRNHSKLVSRLALAFAHAIAGNDPGVRIDSKLLEAAALLHDIDKNAPRLANEHHPDTGVRLLREAGFTEVADLVITHPLHAILDQSIAPKTLEQKLLYLSDKMVKHDIIGVEERFALWRAEQLPQEGKRVLEASFVMVKSLEAEMLAAAGMTAERLITLAKQQDLSTMKLT